MKVWPLLSGSNNNTVEALLGKMEYLVHSMSLFHQTKVADQFSVDKIDDEGL